MGEMDFDHVDVFQSDLSNSDRIAVLVNKKIKVGTIDELRKDPDPWIQEYFSGVREHPNAIFISSVLRNCRLAGCAVRRVF